MPDAPMKSYVGTDPKKKIDVKKPAPKPKKKIIANKKAARK